MGITESKSEVGSHVAELSIDTDSEHEANKESENKQVNQNIQKMMSEFQILKGGDLDDDEFADIFEDGTKLDLENDDNDGDLSTRVSLDRYQAVRRNTLETYKQIVGEDEKASKKKKEQKKFDKIVKQRSKYHTLKRKHTLKDLRQKTGKELQEMRELKHVFFKTLDHARRRDSKKKKTKGTNKDDADKLLRAETYARPWLEQVEVKDAEVTSASALKYNKLEQEINEGIKEDIKKEQELKPEEIAQQVEQIKQLRTELRTKQQKHFSSARAEALRLEKLIKANINRLEGKKRHKFKETYQKGEVTEDDVKNQRRWSLFSPKQKKRKMTLSQQEVEEEEKEFKEEMYAINNELISLRDALNLMKLEKQFPLSMRWKLRIDAGGGLYIGMRDVEIEKLNAKFHVEGGFETGVIRMRVYDLHAILGILEFVFAGKSFLAKFLGGVFTPTVNRLDLVCRGEWELWLRYNQKNSKWVEDTRRSKFNLDFEKKVTGITTIRLPATFVKLLSNTIFPRLISAGLREAFPSHLATFQYEGMESSNVPYLAQENTYMNIHGVFDITGDMSPQVWRCPLYGPTPEALAARKALGGDVPMSLDEAIILDFMLRGPRAVAAGFSSKAISLARLYKWRLQYASYNLQELNDLFNMIQKGSKTRMPDGWFAQIMHRVEELAQKPVTVELQVALRQDEPSKLFKLTSLETDIDLIEATKTSLQVYLAEKKRELESATSEKAKAFAQAELDHFKTKIVSSLTSLNFINNILDDNIKAQISAYVYGGESGFVAAEIRDLTGIGRVPPTFNLPTVIPSQEEDIPIEVQGEDGPEPGEYTVYVLDSARNETTDKDTGTLITLSDIAIELLPKDAGPGCVRLRAGRLRLSAFFPTLDDVITFLFEPEGERERRRKEKVEFQSMDNEVQRILLATQELVSRLKSVSPSEGTSQLINPDEDENPYNSLPDFLVFPHRKLVTEVIDVTVRIEKKGEMMRLITEYNLNKDPNANTLKYKMRQNLADFFENIT